MEPSNSNIRKLLTFFSKESISCISGNKTPEKLLIFSQEETFLIFREIESLKKNSLYLRKWNFSYISGKEYSEPWCNGTFLYFRKWSFLILYFSYISESNSPSSKNNEKKPTLKNLPIFREIKFSSSKLKKTRYIS